MEYLETCNFKLDWAEMEETQLIFMTLQPHEPVESKRNFHNFVYENRKYRRVDL